MLSKMTGGCDGSGHRLVDSILKKARARAKFPEGHGLVRDFRDLRPRISAKWGAADQFAGLSAWSGKRADFSSLPAFPLPVQSGTSTSRPLERSERPSLSGWLVPSSPGRYGYEEGR